MNDLIRHGETLSSKASLQVFHENTSRFKKKILKILIVNGLSDLNYLFNFLIMSLFTYPLFERGVWLRIY